jgi:PAS domain S-box-containing protein
MSSSSNYNHQIARLEAIVDTQQEIASAGLNLGAAMELICERMQRITQAAGAVVEMAEGDEMVYRAASGNAAKSVGLRLKQATSLSGFCVRQGKVLRCDDSETDERVDREACRRVGARSMVVVPLWHLEKTVGVLKVMSPQVQAFSDEDVHALQVMAGLIGSVMARSTEAQAKEELLLERVRAAQALQESQQRFWASFQYSGIGKALVAPDGRWLQVNQALCELVGYRESELWELGFQDITHPDDLTTDLEYVRQMLAGEIRCYQMEKRYLHKQGHEIWVLLSVALVRDGQGEPLYFIAEIQDISAQKEAELQLRSLNDELEQRVTKRTDELAQAKEEAERASHAKTELLSRVSHELRTPLNAVLGFGQLLEMQLHDERQQQQVAEILRAGRHLLELVNRVLDLTAMENGELFIEREAVEVLSLVNETLDSLRPLAQEHQVHLHEPKLAPGWRVYANRHRLQQVLSNLLSNAILFNRSSGEVTVQGNLLEESHRLRLEIIDTGKGIEPGRMASLFEPFVGDPMTNHQQPNSGAGLGLSIAKGFVESMGGSIGAQSTLGQGSAFIIELPVAKAS